MVTARYSMTEPISIARASYSVQKEKCQQRHRHHRDDEKAAEDSVAPRVLGDDALERAAQRRGLVCRERPVHEAGNLRQRARPVRRFTPQVAHQPAPPYLFLHPALEVGLGGAPQVEVGVELAAESLDVEQRLLQHHELRLDLHVEAARSLEQPQQQLAEIDLLQWPREYRLAHRADRRLEGVDAGFGGHPPPIEMRLGAPPG